MHQLLTPVIVIFTFTLFENATESKLVEGF